MPNLKIPTPLRPYAGGQSTLTLAGMQVSDVLDSAVEQYPELKKHLFNEENQLRPFVNLFLGEDNINQLQGLNTTIKEDDTLLIIPSIAGGKVR
jgi:molybdopterin converting factor small subunit